MITVNVSAAKFPILEPIIKLFQRILYGAVPPVMVKSIVPSFIPLQLIFPKTILSIWGPLVVFNSAFATVVHPVASVTVTV